jgi:hypothetical protein
VTAARAAGLLALAAACSVASPEREVREALARLDPAALRAAGGGAELTLERVSFADVAVSPDGSRALVVAFVEAEGRAALGGSSPAVAYRGREVFVVERCPSARWCLAGGALPALSGVVGALAALPRPDGARVVAWQIRVERETASVGEDYELAGERRRETRTLRRDGERWRL